MAADSLERLESIVPAIEVLGRKLLQMVRQLVSPLSAAIVCGTILLAWLFPLSREQYERIQRLLERKRKRLM